MNPQTDLASEPQVETAAAISSTPALESAPPAQADAPRSSPSKASTPLPFSWRDPHPQFVVLLIGKEELPFSIHKDLLCAKSGHYRKHFATQGDDAVEVIVKLPETSTEVFGLAQNFMYADSVASDQAKASLSYEVLVGVWKLGHDFEIHGLCDHTLEVMVEVRQATQHIPAAPLLVQVWKDTPEGSSIRKLLLSWAAEYVRSSEANEEFAKSLPQEVLSELVLAMSRPDTAPPAQFGGGNSMNLPQHLHQRKVVHYLDQDDEDEVEAPFMPVKKPRRSDPFPNGSSAKAVPRKPKAAVAVPKPVPRRRSNPTINGEQQDFTAEQKLLFCQDLLVRMLSGPGFWTRLVGPFKDPVDPVVDNVPDYFEKISKPMDLNTIKAKMDANEYNSHEEFLADMNLIFNNCKTYWKESDSIFQACLKLEKTFFDKYSQMNKWLLKMEGNEGD